MTNRIISLRIDATLLAVVDRMALEGPTSRTEMIERLIREALVRRGELIGVSAPQVKAAERIDGHLKTGHQWEADDEA